MVISMIVFIAECYANYGFTKKLIEELGRKYRDKIEKCKNSHKMVYGRERILKEIGKIINNIRERDAKFVAIIDFERGASRTYIEENFDLIRISELSIYIGVCKKWNNLYAVIFDPCIEEAFICRFKKEDCRNPLILRRYKRREAVNIIKQVFRSVEARKYLDKVIDLLVETMGIK